MSTGQASLLEWCADTRRRGSASVGGTSTSWGRNPGYERGLSQNFVPKLLRHMTYPHCAMLVWQFLEYSWVSARAVSWLDHLTIGNSSCASTNIYQKRHLFSRTGMGNCYKCAANSTHHSDLATLQVMVQGNSLIQGSVITWTIKNSRTAFLAVISLELSAVLHHKYSSLLRKWLDI